MKIYVQKEILLNKSVILKLYQWNVYNFQKINDIDGHFFLYVAANEVEIRHRMIGSIFTPLAHYRVMNWKYQCY